LLFDCRQPAYGCDNERGLGDCKRSPRPRAILRVDPQQSRQIEAERDQSHAIASRHLVGAEQIDSDLLRYRDQRIGSPPEHAFHEQKTPGAPISEVAFEHVTVVGVDQTRVVASSRGQVIEQSRGAAERPGLRHMCVDNLRPGDAERAIDAPERQDVIDGRHRSREAGNIDCACALDWKDRRHISFIGTQTPMNQRCVESIVAEVATETKSLNRRAADIEPRDHARHSNAWSVHAQPYVLK